jgi:hypothetical protein
MESKTKILTAWLIIGVFTLMNAITLEASPSLVNIGVGTRDNIVVINARLLDGFTTSIEEAIESGVPITFTFETELRQVNNFWNDSLISSNTINHTIEYDSLKKVYRFTALGKGIKRKIATRNKQKYQQMMLTLKNIPISSIRRLGFKEKYYVRIKASLETNEFWFPFNHLFFFLPFDNFDGEWAESSPLSIDPDLAFAKDLKSDENKSKNKTSFEGTKSVVRSFNQ